MAGNTQESDFQKELTSMAMLHKELTQYDEATAKRVLDAVLSRMKFEKDRAPVRREAAA